MYYIRCLIENVKHNLFQPNPRRRTSPTGSHQEGAGNLGSMPLAVPCPSFVLGVEPTARGGETEGVGARGQSRPLSAKCFSLRRRPVIGWWPLVGAFIICPMGMRRWLPSPRDRCPKRPPIYHGSALTCACLVPPWVLIGFCRAHHHATCD